MPPSLAALTSQVPVRTDGQDDSLPNYDEELVFLRQPERVFAHLGEIDWSFVQDEIRFLAHDIHPYPAKFIPQIPGTLIAKLSARGELVFDPFGGSGTTALEAVRLGRRALSVDANPLSALIGRAKTTAIDRVSAHELHGLHAALGAELDALPADPSALVRRHRAQAPAIPNREKWFADSAFGELCLIKSRIAGLETGAAKDIASVALSRIAIRASFQDSETRYTSVPREVPVGETLKRYLKELRSVTESVVETESVTRFGLAQFVRGDVRTLGADSVPDGSVDLIVTSPPYGNATDYHLYHRFRLLWLGFDPVELGKMEIGSHLKHQREGSGFDSYFGDLRAAVSTMARVLRPGRYAALVLGDSIYGGKRFDPAEGLRDVSEELGFDACAIFDRPVHRTKRSFAHAGRRATSERIVVLRKRARRLAVQLGCPPYKMWPYEKRLRVREVGLPVLGKEAQSPETALTLNTDVAGVLALRAATFSHSISAPGFHAEPTWQAVLENGGASSAAARKDPKYVTHGLHPYKGKFYPQLAKALLNLTRAEPGTVLFDPFCGSGTTLLEGYLNGFRSVGCDMNPLAAKIARAKTEILETDPDVLAEAVTTLLDAVGAPPARFPDERTEFATECLEEIERWFPEPVITKLNWLLRHLRKTSAGSVRDFLEVVLSSVIRDVSQQEPTDLRIRYRKELLQDADLLGLFREQLQVQFGRVEKFWRVRGRAPIRFHRAHAVEGDNRQASTLAKLGLGPNSVDVVLTSPPYATALPYIDTDRLSLLSLMGVSGSARRPLELGLTGSREISTAERRRLEDVDWKSLGLPVGSVSFLAKLRGRLARDEGAGFRKQNMPALMVRYLPDMASALKNAHSVAKRGADLLIVIGDNRTDIGGETVPIPTTALVDEIAVSVGFVRKERVEISVTTENLLNQKNAITENAVLWLTKG